MHDSPGALTAIPAKAPNTPICSKDHAIYRDGSAPSRFSGNPTKQLLGSRDALVLECPHHYATVLCLALRRFVVAAYLAALSHCAWSQHVGQRNMTLLQQNVGDILGAFIAELLVQGNAARGCSATFDLYHVALNRLRFFSQCYQLRRVLGVDFHLAIAEIDGDFVDDVVIVELAKTRAVGRDSRFVGGNLLLLFVRCLLLFFQRRVLGSQGGILLFQFFFNSAGIAVGFRTNRPE